MCRGALSDGALALEELFEYSVAQSVGDELDIPHDNGMVLLYRRSAGAQLSG